MHTKGLVERLGDATEESHRRMQSALDIAFPQALGMFEPLGVEADLTRAGIFPGNAILEREWLKRISSVLAGSSLRIPLQSDNGNMKPGCKPDSGGRRKLHSGDLKELVDDLQLVYRLVPGGKW
jgi:ring-1,2-phenylacetyl-CoA epoxidase subunit PaaC